MVPTKPDLTATGSLSEFKASAFNFKSLRTTSPEKQDISTLAINEQLTRNPWDYITTYVTFTINQYKLLHNGDS